MGVHGGNSTRYRSIIAIPKPNGGVRPVAIGEVWMKLAGLVLIQRFETTLRPLFTPIQQGVLSKGGCERVVHKLNEINVFSPLHHNESKPC